MKTDRKTVLCVDDEINILNALKRLLRKEEYNLLTANSGLEGIALIEKQPVHLVLSDQMMPEMMGTAFLQKVKEVSPDTVRVVLSGYADVSVILDAINKGEIYRFLTKPWNDEELKVSINQCLAHYDLMLENRLLMEQIQVQNEKLRTLNDRLEEAVAERTKALQLSQEILEKLPVPVIGVSEEGMVVFTNEMIRSRFVALCPMAVGMDIQEIFPTDVVNMVRQCMDRNLVQEISPFQIQGQKLRLRIKSLQERNTLRGCILVMEDCLNGK